MSKEELKRFRQDVKGNPDLRKQFRQARRKALHDVVASFASAAGYSVSVEDFGKADKKQAEAT